MNEDFSILINVPQGFFKEYPGGKEEYIRIMTGPVNEGETVWYNCISNVPLKPVVYCYLIFDGKVQFRANIMEFMRKTDMRFADGGKMRSFKDKNWAVLTGPIIKAPIDIPHRGMQGFRYCKQLF